MADNSNNTPASFVVNAGMGWNRAGTFLLFLGCWFSIILVCMLLKNQLDLQTRFILRIAQAALFLVAALALAKAGRKEHAQAFYALFTIAVAFFLAWQFSQNLLEWLVIKLDTPAGYAVSKFSEMIWTVVPIIVLIKLSGQNMDSLYLAKGRLKKSLVIGLAGFAFFAATSFFAAQMIFKGQNLSLAKTAPWIPWILIFVLANGFMEELCFRGLFLKRLRVLLDPFLSNLLLALAFATFHLQVKYSADVIFFAVLTFFLGLLWGYVMQKTDNLWGAALFHAGADVPVLLGIFSNFS